MKNKTMMIRMSALGAVGTLVLLAFAGLPVSATCDLAYTAKVDLMAGQDTYVGYVEVTYDLENFYVDYVITEAGWGITETHFAITALDSCANCPSGIPMTKSGSPKVGNFPFKGEHDFVTEVSYTIDFDSEDIAGSDAGFQFGECICFAAHAVVENRYGCTVIDEQTAWGEGTPFAKSWAMYYCYEPKSPKVPTFPETAKAKNVLVYSTGPGYWQMQFSGVSDGYNLKNGNLVAWCIQSCVYITSGSTLTYELYSSLNPPTSDPNLVDDDWDLINYILNKRVQGYYNSWTDPAIVNEDIQRAIWYFMEQPEPYKPSVTLTLTDGAEAIVEDAEKYGEGYIPGLDDSNVTPVVAVVCYYSDSTQRIIIELDP